MYCTLNVHWTHIIRICIHCDARIPVMFPGIVLLKSECQNFDLYDDILFYYYILSNRCLMNSKQIIRIK